MNAPHHHLGDELLNSWLDGVATDAERSLVDTHLETCEACRESLESLRQVKRALSELPQPELPRSFQLTPEQAKKPTPVRTNSEPSNIVQMLPVARMLSIAAVIAFLVFGGASALGPGQGINSGDDPAITTSEGTDQAEGALDDADAEAPPAMSALPVDIDEGEIVSRGDSATGSDTSARALDEMAQDQAPEVAESNDDSNLLVIATITAGVIAIAASALWFGLSRVNRQSTS